MLKSRRFKVRSSRFSMRQLIKSIFKWHLSTAPCYNKNKNVQLYMQYNHNTKVQMFHLQANLMPTKTVYLWLGANVMLEYSLEDAENLLTTNMATAKKNLSCVEHDLDFLRYYYLLISLIKALIHELLSTVGNIFSAWPTSR